MIHSKKRKNMKHIEDMNDLAFLQWMGSQYQDRLDLSWKLDGFFLRFGKDKHGAPFFQTARSGPLYDPMEVIWYAVGKGYDSEAMTRAENYFHLIKKIWASDIMTDLPKDSCVECEVFDKAASKLDKETGLRTFVNIPYDDKFFKRDVTLFLYRLTTATTGDTWVRGYYDDLYVDSNIATLGTRFVIDIDLQYFTYACLEMTGEEVRALTSLKHADRELKLATKSKIARIKTQFKYYVLSRVKPKMGENFEGVVVTVNNVEYKIVTDYFRDLIRFKDVIGG